MPFILAFIAFNLLDLDASDLAALTRCFDHFVVDADLTAPRGVDPLPENFDYPQTKAHQNFAESPRSDRCYMRELRSPSRLEKVRTHLYHVSLPRDSVPGLGSSHHGGPRSSCQDISPFFRAAGCLFCSESKRLST